MGNFNFINAFTAGYLNFNLRGRPLPPTPFDACYAGYLNLRELNQSIFSNFTEPSFASAEIVLVFSPL